MKEKSKEAKQDFEDRFEELMTGFSDRLSDHEMEACVSAVLARRQRSPSAEDRPHYDPDTATITLNYTDASGLESAIEEFLKIQAICVDVEGVPLMSDITVRVSGAGKCVELAGRSVQQTPAGMAVQLFSAGEDTRTNLQAIPKAIRESASRQSSRRDPKRKPEPQQTRQAKRPRPSAGDSDLFGPGPTAEKRESPSRASRQPVDNLFGPTSTGTARRPRTLADFKPLVRASKEWDLDETSMTEILLKLAVNQATGMLEVGDHEKKLVVVDRGRVLDIESSPPSQRESLGNLLKSANQIDEKALSRANEYSEAHGISVREALLTLGIVPYEPLRVALKTRVVYLFDTLWEIDGSARFFPSEDPPTRPLNTEVDIVDAVFSHVHDACKKSEEAFERALAEFEGVAFRAAENPPVPLDQAELHPAQSDLMKIRMGDGKSFNQIVRLAHCDKYRALAALKTLIALGFLDTHRARPLSRVHTQSVEQIDLIYARIDSQNHFDILGCHWSAYAEEVEDSYRAIEKKLDPERLGELLEDEDFAERVQKVRARVDEAYRVLKDPGKRSEHRKEVVDPFKLETSVDMFERQADTAKLRRDIEAAIDFLERIVELRPMAREAKRELRILRELV